MKTATSLLCVVAFVSAAWGDGEFKKASESAARLIEQARVDHQIPGMSAAVAINGNLVWSEGFGHTDREANVGITPETKFRLGSVSKVVTIAAVAKLYEDGRLDLDAPIQKYVPSFPGGGSKDLITARLLAGHLAGIRHYLRKDTASRIDITQYDTTQEALAIFRDDPLVSVPGEKYAYSTFGYTLLSAAVEGAAGQPFLDYMREEVFGPLRMDHTMADYGDREVLGKTGFFVKTPSGRIFNAPRVNPSYKWAGGGMLSTPEDLVKFVSAHLKPGFLKAATLDTLFASQHTASGEATNVGIGWRIGADPAGRPIVHHAGSMSGCRSLVLAYPESGTAVAIVSNLSATPGPVLGLGQELAGPFLEAPETP